MLALINMDIVVMVFNSLHVNNFNYQTEARAKMLLLFELIIVLLYVLMIKSKIS